MKEQITIVVPIKAKDETRDEVRTRLMEMVRLTRKEAGNINYTLHEEIGNPGSFVIYENWKDQAALDIHMNQDYLKKLLADASELFKEEIRGTLCRVICE
ncbi:MAG: hypothetical protein A2020_01415 [Lentisphaerae bacterium GWF2_45_14]|nr:MAG: hypothetical protein A2020_01415 [Lentisphaerae bacterium GWF2_45_14]